MQFVRLLAVTAALAAAVAALGPAGAAEEKKPYAVGDRVEDFALPDTSGKTVKLSDYKDKVVVLQFYAHW